MRKRLFNIMLLLMFMVISLFLKAPVGEAGTIGDPVPCVSEGRWMVTAELDNWDKDMDDEVDLESTRLFAKFTYGLSEKVDVFGRIGFSEFEIKTADSDYEPAFGAGFKIKVYDTDKIEAGLVGQFFLFSGDIEGVDFDVTEVDIAYAVSHRFSDLLSGYGGLSISIVEVDFDNVDLEEDDPFYFFGGIEYKLNDTTDIGFEIRIFGESSFTFFANFDL